jgi:hypothetical protein
MRDEDIAKKQTNRKHNSLQHDSTIAVPLLEALLSKINNKNDPRDVLRKTILKARKSEKETIKSKITEKTEDEDSIEVIANEVEEVSQEGKKKKDAAAALADRIKKLYAGEVAAQAYNQANISQYNPATGYSSNSVMANSKMYNAQAYENPNKIESSEADNNGKKRLEDENSNAYKLSGGSKYQALIMTDPKGRLRSRWTMERVLNESSDGVIELNNGLHYQGLS